MTTSQILQAAGEHLLISGLAFVIGAVPGGLLGIGLAKVRGRITTPSSAISRWLILVPWRTLILAVLIFIHVPFYLIMRTGPGVKMGLVGTSTYLFLFSLALAETRFQSTSKPFDKLRVAHLARSLAVFSVLITYHFGVFAAGGLGTSVFKSVQLFDFQAARTAFALLLLIAFIFDELMGIGEFLLRRSDPRS